MKISRKGLDELIKPHEGYLARQKDGSCRAYKCPAGVWTCGWGCTEGVDAHTHWTLEQATEALAVEMEQHEAHIRRLVKVPLNQGQFDALVSLCYNVGPGAIGKSDLLKHLNAGDFPRAASHFADFKSDHIIGAAPNPLAGALQSLGAAISRTFTPPRPSSQCSSAPSGMSLPGTRTKAIVRALSREAWP